MVGNVQFSHINALIEMGKGQRRGRGIDKLTWYLHFLDKLQHILYTVAVNGTGRHKPHVMF